MYLQELKDSVIDGKVNVLSFDGVTQMTDFVLFSMMIHNKDGKYTLFGPDACKAKCDTVVELDLSGCIYLTDAGVQCIPELFPNLEEVSSLFLVL